MTEHAKEFKLSELLMIADRHGGSVFTRSLYEFSKIAAKLEAENEKLNTISADLFKSRLAIIEHNEEMKTENEKLSAEIAELKNVVNAFKDAYIELTNSEVHFDSGIAHIANLQLMEKFDAAFDLIPE